MISLFETYNKNLNDLSFELIRDEDRLTINLIYTNEVVGYIVVEHIINGFWMFNDYLSEDEYYEIFPNDQFYD